MWFYKYIFLFWSTEFNYSLYIVACARKDLRCSFERRLLSIALFSCTFPVTPPPSPTPARTSYVQNNHQDQCDVSRLSIALRSNYFS